MKRKKKLLFSLFFIIGTILIGGVFLSQLLTFNLTKDLINKKLTTLLKKNSHVDGAIEWQFLPSLGIKVNRLRIGENNRAEDFFYIKSFVLQVNLIPLLHGHVVFNELKIEGLEAFIH